MFWYPILKDETSKLTVTHCHSMGASCLRVPRSLLIMANGRMALFISHEGFINFPYQVWFAWGERVREIHFLAIPERA